MAVSAWVRGSCDIGVLGVGVTGAGYRPWPEPARAMALAVDAAVSAARSGAAAAFADAIAELGRMDREQLAVLLGAVTRDLLERSHPDGLGAGDAEQVLLSCARSAGWYEVLDADLLVVALTGALGVSDPEEAPPRDGAAVVAHGLLLIADQLRLLSQELPPVLASALAELMRAQTIELP
jgi:hypothetical protein